MDMKRCSKCGEMKLIECFCRNKRTKDGRAIWCKSCYTEYRNNPIMRAYMKAYGAVYREKPGARESHRKYDNNLYKNDQAHREKKKSYQRAYSASSKKIKGTI